MEIKMITQLKKFIQPKPYQEFLKEALQTANFNNDIKNDYMNIYEQAEEKARISYKQQFKEGKDLS